MPTIVRIPITNVYADGDYTGVINVGPGKKPMNVLLDTGSSALALDGTKYAPDFAKGDQSSSLAQTDSYGDGSSWTGAVIKSTITVGVGAAGIGVGLGAGLGAAGISSSGIGASSGFSCTRSGAAPNSAIPRATPSTGSEVGRNFGMKECVGKNDVGNSDEIAFSIIKGAVAGVNGARPWRLGARNGTSKSGVRGAAV